MGVFLELFKSTELKLFMTKNSRIISIYSLDFWEVQVTNKYLSKKIEQTKVNEILLHV